MLWLNQWAGRTALLDWPEKLIVGDQFIPVCMSFCILAMWFVARDPQARNGHQRAVLRALIAVGFANLVVLILNGHYFRERPFAEHELTLLFYQPTDSSFPANPAAVAFAMASGMWQGSRRVGAFLYGLATPLGTVQDICGSLLSLRRGGRRPHRGVHQPPGSDRFKTRRTLTHPGAQRRQDSSPGLSPYPSSLDGVSPFAVN